jgi:hypothetical protein
VLPTIADVLELGVEKQFDGVSLRGRRPNREIVSVLAGSGVTFEASLETIGDQLEATVLRNVRLFGEGRDSIYRIGRNKQLLGARAPAEPPPSPTVRVRLEGRQQLRDVRLSSSFLPVHISGTVQRGALGHDVELAVSVNGRIWALTRCFRDENGTTRFRALVPAEALVEGGNRVDVFAIEPRSAGRRLVLLGSTSGS